MRIQPVTGDLPAVAQPDVVGPVVPAPRREPASTAVAAPAAGGDAESYAAERRARQPLRHFDPPLIAQRAALGLPVGRLVLEMAQAEGISYSAAWAAVDNAMPVEHTPEAAG